jgi:hypothetical protein
MDEPAKGRATETVDELCKQIAVERDTKKLRELIRKLSELLAERRSSGQTSPTD